MAQSTNTPAETAKKKGPQEVLVDEASLQAIIDADKNKQIAVQVHPAFHVAILRALASDPANVTDENGKRLLKRTAYTQSLRAALAEHFKYEGDLVKLGRQGGNVMGLVSVFKTTVRGMFDMARTMAQMNPSMGEDQVKQLAFTTARNAITANPQLASVEYDDSLLEAIWTGSDSNIGVEDEDEDEDEDEA